jgi:hypothetical protein
MKLFVLFIKWIFITIKCFFNQRQNFTSLSEKGIIEFSYQMISIRLIFDYLIVNNSDTKDLKDKSKFIDDVLEYIKKNIYDKNNS